MNVEWNEVLEEWQTTIGTVLITSPSKADVEKLLDRLDEQPKPAWGGAEIAIASGFAMALLGVLAAGWQIAVWLLYE
jgi:hypothetical protein